MMRRDARVEVSLRELCAMLSVALVAACSGPGMSLDGATLPVEPASAAIAGMAAPPVGGQSIPVAGRAPSAPVERPALGGAGAASPMIAAGSGGAESTTRASSAAPSAAGSGGAKNTGGAGSAAPSAAGSDAPAACDSRPAPIIYVIGDSTASVYEADLYPRMGWAQPLQEYFRAECAKVQDKALSGRSSKSFFDEGAWTPIRTALQQGDFVLIQFGHNDEKRDDPTRYTEPFGSYQEHLSRYIDDTLAAKATPILLTPIERNKWSSGKLSDTHGEYPEAVRQLAQMRQLTLVDMTALTRAHLEDLGQSAASKLFMNLAPGEFPNYPSGSSDDTHLQDKGAHAIAELALAELERQGSPLAAWVSDH